MFSSHDCITEEQVLLFLPVICGISACRSSPMIIFDIFQLDKHIEDICPKTKINCDYEGIGCDHRVSREKL